MPRGGRRAGAAGAGVSTSAVALQDAGRRRGAARRAPPGGRPGALHPQGLQPRRDPAARLHRQVQEHPRLPRGALLPGRLPVPQARLPQRQALLHAHRQPGQGQVLPGVAPAPGGAQPAHGRLLRRGAVPRRAGQHPPNMLKPSVPYVQGKYYYFRTTSTRRSAGFRGIDPGQQVLHALPVLHRRGAGAAEGPGRGGAGLPGPAADQPPRPAARSTSAT